MFFEAISDDGRHTTDDPMITKAHHEPMAQVSYKEKKTKKNAVTPFIYSVGGIIVIKEIS